MTEYRGGWTATDPKTPYEFERTVEGHVFRAYRHRTDYGWSWWEVTKDDKPYMSPTGELFNMPLFV